jgi:hypothetical protein
MRVLSRITIPNSLPAQNSNGTVAQQEKLESVNAEGTQATMEGFLNKETD